MGNFVNEAIWGKFHAQYVGQGDFFADLKAWWDGLDPMYRYAIMSGTALIAILIVIAIAKPSRAAGEMAEIRELMKLRMMKELA